MNRIEKAEKVKAFGEGAANVPFILIAEYRGTKVSEINGFRRELEKHGMRYQVMKNTLARRAFEEAGIKGLGKSLKGMTGVVFSNEDAIGSAKILKDVLKTLPTIKVRVGFFDNSAIETDPVKVVAEMPSREDLLSALLATLQEGPRQLVCVVQAPARDLLYLLKNYETKLAESAS